MNSIQSDWPIGQFTPYVPHIASVTHHIRERRNSCKENFFTTVACSCFPLNVELSSSQTSNFKPYRMLKFEYNFEQLFF